MRPTCRRVMPPICQTTRTPCLTDGRRGSAAGLRGARSSLRVRPTPLASPGLVGRTPAAAPWRDTRGGSDSPATDAVARCWTTPARPSPPVVPRQRRKPSPLSWRSTGVSPAGRSVPKRVRHAISSARSASWARPRSANSQPTIARSCSRSLRPGGPPSRPQYTWQLSIAQRSLERSVRERACCTRGFGLAWRCGTVQRCSRISW